MKLAVIGSRKLPEFDLGPYLPAGTTQIISGGAKGVDSIAAAYAQNHGIPLVEYRPDYQRYGRAAPLVRNRQIVDSCDMVLAFWDGVSRGTVYTVRYAKQKGVPCKLYRYRNGME